MGSPECESNKELEKIVPILYGAVFSFAFYVAAIIVSSLFEGLYPKDGSAPTDTLFIYKKFGKQFILYILIVIYMIMDIGSVLKLSTKYPYKNHSRYLHEIFIAFLYISALLFLERGIYISIFCFSLVIFWGGIWCNQLKEEYLADESNVAEYMKTLRDLHYFFGSIISIEAIFFFFNDQIITISTGSLICFSSTYLLWILIYIFVPIIRHGEGATRVSLNFIIPYSIIRKITESKPFNFV